MRFSSVCWACKIYYLGECHIARVARQRMSMRVKLLMLNLEVSEAGMNVILPSPNVFESRLLDLFANE